MKRYYITDRLQLGGSVDALVEAIVRNISSGVDYIQIREKDLAPRQLLVLTLRAVELSRASNTRILVNDRADIALAAGAHGVHLRSDAIAPAVWRTVLPAGFLIACSCHTLDDLRDTEAADFVVYGPVFATPGKGPAIGLDALREAVHVSPVPLFALGGITQVNAASCIEAGAAGIAAIRMFQEN